MATLGKNEFPEITLSASIELARRIHEELHGEVRRDALAHLTGMSPSGGAFAARIAALRIWKLATGRSIIRLTQQGQQISSTSDPELKIRLMNELAQAVPMFNELNQRLQGNPLDQNILAAILREITNAEMPEIIRRTPLIERIFNEIRPLLNSNTHPTNLPSNTAQTQPQTHQYTEDQPNAHERSITNPDSDITAQGWIKLTFDNGTISLQETPENIEIMIQALASRKRQLQNKPNQQIPPLP